MSDLKRPLLYEERIDIYEHQNSRTPRIVLTTIIDQGIIGQYCHQGRLRIPWNGNRYLYRVIDL
jgi:hypothetical protein